MFSYNNNNNNNNNIAVELENQIRTKLVFYNSSDCQLMILFLTKNSNETLVRISYEIKKMTINLIETNKTELRNECYIRGISCESEAKAREMCCFQLIFIYNYFLCKI